VLSDIKEKLLEAELHKDERILKIGFILTGVAIALLLANILYLNVSLSKRPVTQAPNQVIQTTPSSSSIPTPQPTPSIVPQAINVIQNSPAAASAVQDYYIPLGSGSSQAGDFTDVPGTQSIFDLGQYKNVKEIRFEASVYIPNAAQTVSVRLYNQTDKHTVWNSEVSTSNNSAFLTSAPISYDNGAKTYQVQMKTQLQAPANLSQARIHVVLN